ncbi:kinase-like domain-containing protein [Hyaloraphidium curvatum]|nr:kinase-like domain-containing protein [Hyaloraphidium curvatum]
MGRLSGRWVELRTPEERAPNAQRRRREREEKDRPPPSFALPLRKWLRVADLDIDRSRKLGEGGFGTVYAGRYLSADVAVKEPLLFGDGEAVLEDEIGVSVDMPGHDNVAESIGYHIQPTYLVSKLYRGGDLGGFLQRTGWQRALTLQLLHGAATGMWFLHSRGIVHAYLKPGNVLVDTLPDGSHPVAKIADFGLARARTQIRGASGTQYEYIGARGFSLRYASPEQVRAEPPGRASDVWSFGMLCYEILSRGTKPYEGLHPAGVGPTRPVASGPQLTNAFLPQTLFAISEGTLPQRAFDISDSDWELLTWICQRRASDRPSMEAVAGKLNDPLADHSSRGSGVSDELPATRQPEDSSSYSAVRCASRTKI